jgi:hypothetical protein
MAVSHGEHPLTIAARMIDSGFMDPEQLARARDDFLAGPRTSARLRESIFEILGEGWRGCMPVALDAVMDPETVESSLGVAAWVAVGFIDDAAVLRLSDGKWFVVDTPAEDPDRQVVIFPLASEEEARELEDDLAEGKKPIWVVPATRLLEMGLESEYRAFMDGDVPPAEA